MTPNLCSHSGYFENIFYFYKWLTCLARLLRPFGPLVRIGDMEQTLSLRDMERTLSLRDMERTLSLRDMERTLSLNLAFDL